MKITFGELLQFNADLISASNITGNYKFSYAIGKNLLKIKPLMKEFDEEKQVIVDAANIPLKPDNTFDFTNNSEAKKSLDDLVKKEVELPELHSVIMTEEMQKLPLSGAQIAGLDLILKDESK